ncbi:MAG: preprotein translocase subunit SecE [Pirellulales bacterium]
MAKDDRHPFVRVLFDAGLYKRSQGRIARQATFAVLAGTVVLGCWRLSLQLVQWGSLWQYLVPMLLAVVGVWICFRVINFPQFADFLIAVEAEMNKVSWPTRDTLFRSTFVVMFTIFVLAAILFLYDIIWKTALSALGIS